MSLQIVYQWVSQTSLLIDMIDAVAKLEQFDKEIYTYWRPWTSRMPSTAPHGLVF